jgi:hypothetical protein
MLAFVARFGDHLAGALSALASLGFETSLGGEVSDGIALLLESTCCCHDTKKPPERCFAGGICWSVLAVRSAQHDDAPENWRRRRRPVQRARFLTQSLGAVAPKETQHGSWLL